MNELKIVKNDMVVESPGSVNEKVLVDSPMGFPMPLYRFKAVPHVVALKIEGVQRITEDGKPWDPWSQIPCKLLLKLEGVDHWIDAPPRWGAMMDAKLGKYFVITEHYVTKIMDGEFFESEWTPVSPVTKTPNFSRVDADRLSLEQ